MKKKNPIQQSAKTAGIAYLLIIGTSILSMIFGPYTLMVEGDIASSIINISENQMLFRIGATYDLFMFIGVIILSVALYRIVSKVNKTIALTALFSRIGEALLGSLTVVFSIAILILINKDLNSDPLISTVEFLFDVKAATLNIVFALLGFGSILYCYLFYKARLIPRWLAAFGIFAFTLVFCESIAVLLFSVKSTILTGVSAILFEIIIGIWLIVKGVNLSKISTNIKN